MSPSRHKFEEMRRIGHAIRRLKEARARNLEADKRTRARCDITSHLKPVVRKFAEWEPTPAPIAADFGQYYTPEEIRDFRLMLAARDGWRCWLCLEAIDSTMSPQHTLGPTFDHVLPRSKGGRGSPENIRLAHEYCNRKRGNKLVGELTEDERQRWALYVRKYTVALLKRSA